MPSPTVRRSRLPVADRCPDITSVTARHRAGNAADGALGASPGSQCPDRRHHDAGWRRRGAGERAVPVEGGQGSWQPAASAHSARVPSRIRGRPTHADVDAPAWPAGPSGRCWRAALPSPRRPGIESATASRHRSATWTARDAPAVAPFAKNGARSRLLTSVPGASPATRPGWIPPGPAAGPPADGCGNRPPPCRGRSPGTSRSHRRRPVAGTAPPTSARPRTAVATRAAAGGHPEDSSHPGAGAAGTSETGRTGVERRLQAIQLGPADVAGPAEETGTRESTPVLPATEPDASTCAARPTRSGRAPGCRRPAPGGVRPRTPAGVIDGCPAGPQPWLPDWAYGAPGGCDHRPVGGVFSRR